MTHIADQQERTIIKNWLLIIFELLIIYMNIINDDQVFMHDREYLEGNLPKGHSLW